ncbi:hypothetical protein JHK82_031336 [Glycine max]|nr:hypothetical protein JHK82_031336 [Glycine max]
MKTGSSSSPQPTTIGKGKKTEKLKRATVWEWRAKVEQLRRHTRHLRRPIGRRNHRFSRRIGFDPMAAVFTSADPRGNLLVLKVLNLVYISGPDFNEMGTLHNFWMSGIRPPTRGGAWDVLDINQFQRDSKGLRIDGALRIGDAPFSVRNIEQTFELIQLMMEVVLVQRVLGPFGTRITSGVPGIGIEIPDVVDCAVFRTGAVNAASGSAYAEFGNTKVIVSVFGPRESKKAMMYSDIGRLNCNVSFTTFATPIRGQGAIILETFPKTTVDVFALVLESSGSNSISECVAGDLPVVISCASLALADAGIMMYDIVASVSVSCFNKNLVIDPILEEEIGQDGSLMITCMPSRYEITQLTVTGEWSTTKINEGMQLCLDACAKLAKIMRSCLKEVASDSQE